MKMVKQTLFRTFAVGIGTAAMGFYSGGETGLHSKYSMGEGECRAKDQGGSKITEEKYQEEGRFWLKLT